MHGRQASENRSCRKSRRAQGKAVPPAVSVSRTGIVPASMTEALLGSRRLASDAVANEQSFHEGKPDRLLLILKQARHCKCAEKMV